MRLCSAPCSGGNPGPSLTPHTPACPQHPTPVSPRHALCPSHAQRDPPKVSHIALLLRPCLECRRLHRGPWGSAWPGPRLPCPPLRSARAVSLWPLLLLLPPDVIGSSLLPCPVFLPGAFSGPAPSFSVPRLAPDIYLCVLTGEQATVPVFVLHAEVGGVPLSPPVRPSPVPAVLESGPRGLSASGSFPESLPCHAHSRGARHSPVTT